MTILIGENEVANRKFDDVYKRKKYKDTRYGEKKSCQDDYTGERIFRGNERESLYKHPINKTSDTDHITPGKVVQERYLGLTDEQKKVLANDESNYAITSSRLNRSKGDLENHEYLMRQLKKGEPEDLKTSVRMVTKEIDSRIHMDIAASGMYIQNAVADAKKALTASAVPLAILAAQNLVAVANNEKTFSEAAKDVGVMAGKVATAGVVTGFAFRAFVTPAPDYVVADMTKVGNIAQIGNVIIVADLITRTTARYLNGEISGEEFFYDIGNDAVGMIGGVLSHKLFTMCSLPGPILASMIGSAVCREIYAQANKLREEKKDNQEIREIAEAANAELKVQQEELHRLMEESHAFWAKEMDESFRGIAEGLVTSNVSEVNQNLRKLAKSCAFYDSGNDALDDLFESRTGGKPMRILSGK